MPKPHARVVELDILRAVAIIMIIFAHAFIWLPTVKLSNFGVGYYSAFAPPFSWVSINALGVSLFLFISGFVLYLNHPSFPQRNGLTDFFKKRVLRIFPLYWLSIAFAIFLGGSQFAALPVLVLGLQGFLSPIIGTDLTTGWWFVGVILVLYTIYPLIAAIASDALRLPARVDSDELRCALILIVPLLVLAVIHIALSLIDTSVFIYYGIFVLGVVTSKYDMLSKYGFLTDDRKSLLKYVAVAAVSFTAVLFIYTLPQYPPNVSAVSFFARAGFFFVLMNTLFVLFALLTFCLARIAVVSSSKAPWPPSRPVWLRPLLMIAFSSYAIYLFFDQILVLFMDALMSTQLTALGIDIVQIFVGLPAVVVIAFVLQSTQNEILNRVKKYRAASSPSSDSNE